MTNLTKEKNNVTTLENAEELNLKINDAIVTLDRNIEFISNCDNKTSIVLAAIGGILTIILTSDGVNTIFNIIKVCITQKNFCNVLYLIFFLISISILLFGFFNLCNVLIARTQNTVNPNSKIFFSGIIKNI